MTNSISTLAYSIACCAQLFDFTLSENIRLLREGELYVVDVSVSPATPIF